MQYWAHVKNQLGPLLRRAHTHFSPPLFANGIAFSLPELSAEARARDDIFLRLWGEEVEVRRSAFALKWHRGRRDLAFKKDWNTIFASWDRINQALGLSSDRHVKKMHSLRSTRASVSAPGCWIYRLWCLKDGRSYIGQTRAQGNFRRTADHGRDHIRLGADYFRG